MHKRRQLPLPDQTAPISRRDKPVPPPPSNEPSGPAPPLPTRPMRPTPPTPKEESVSSDAGQETYDDFEEFENYEEQAVYDDGEVGEIYTEADEANDKPPPPPPGRRLPPPPKLPIEQDTYEVEPEPQMNKTPNLPSPPSMPDCDNIYEVEPVVPELKPAAPAYPEETYEVTDELQDTYDEFDFAEQEVEEHLDQDTYDEFDVADKEEENFDEIQDTYDEFEMGPPNDVYEPVEESISQGQPPPPPPPPPGRPKATPPAPKKQPPAAKNVPPKPKPAPKAGGGGLDLNAIAGGLNKLKKVDKTVLKKEPSVEEKIYPDDNTEFKSVFEKFKQRDAENSGNKPNLLPKSPGFATKSNVLSPTTKSPTSPKPVIPSKKPDLPALEKRPPPDMKSPSPPPLPNHNTRPPPPPPVDDEPSSPPPPPPPKIETVPNKPPAHGYSQVNLPPPPSEVTNGGSTMENDDFDDDEDGDIYDDAMSNSDPLMGEKYYFKGLGRTEGEKKLKIVGKDGAFLIRDSSKGGSRQPYTLMVMYLNKLYNLKIRERNDGKYALGEEKADEMAFLDVKGMVDYHRENEVILVHKAGQYKTCLEYFPKN